jgi:signal peptidase I
MLRISKPTTWRGAVFEWVLVVAVAIGLAVGVQSAVAKPYEIPSGSMLPTLEVGQRVIVDRLSYRFGDPEVGDVIVFNPPVGASPSYRGAPCGSEPPPDAACSRPLPEPAPDAFVKRIVAGPGDRLAISHGHPVINGELARENFIIPCRSASVCNLTTEITIPEDHYFVMGDNRGASFDSRAWGPVPRDWIIGPARLTYWPIDRIGGV